MCSLRVPLDFSDLVPVVFLSKNQERVPVQFLWRFGIETVHCALVGFLW